MMTIIMTVQNISICLFGNKTIYTLYVFKDFFLANYSLVNTASPLCLVPNS
jgi:hypothetical protein